VGVGTPHYDLFDLRADASPSQQSWRATRPNTSIIVIDSELIVGKKEIVRRQSIVWLPRAAY